ncbi:hypothetical protein GCM10010492_55070 [Saccharothrix mutabilis subsp. mutabilis]|uniref:STAS domain-containing protein n=1 Tax=Saccharothrix mutabilis subsp. mutabilis TaxID=66855 RepID=A0ABN0UEV4_9PSEU
MSAALSCALSTTDGLATVALSGDLVYGRDDGLLGVVDQALATRAAVVVLDCAGLTHCDSHGLSTLLAAHHRASAAGATLTVRNPPAVLDRLLRRTNTHLHLTGDTPAR